MLDADPGQSFDRAARSAGVLTAGRQLGAVVLTAGVLLLPRYADHNVLDPFLWAYFGQLLVSSLLNVGLERFTAREVAGGSQRADRASALGAALCGRVATAPLTPLALAVLLNFVHVHLSVGAWVALTLWTIAVQFQSVLFASLRAAGHVRTEAAIALGGRAAQTVVLLLAAVSGWGVAGLLGAVAVIEGVVTVISWGRASEIVGIRGGTRLPYRKLAVYTALEGLVFAYLRVDLLLVGRLLGASAGATYGLGYRFVDALVALSTPALLVLFAHASREAARGVDLAETRRRAHALLPQLGVALAAVAIAGVGLLAGLLPRVDSAVPALRLILATVPLTYLIGAEALLLSAEDRNRPVLTVAGASLVANVLLNLVLVPRFGMVGAAAALVVTEVGQAVGLAVGAGAKGALTSLHALAVPVALLLMGGIALNQELGLIGNALLTGALVLAARRFRTGLAQRPTLVAA